MRNTHPAFVIETNTDLSIFKFESGINKIYNLKIAIIPTTILPITIASDFSAP